jgi:hypothetical protein
MKKNKNPLYVVSGQEVEEANGLVDFLVKKLKLEPAINFLNMIFDLLLSQVDSYPVFIAVKEFIDLVMKRIELFQRVSVF